jgi:hypothetical protein
MEEETEKKGFTISDRRHSATGGRDSPPASSRAPERGTPEEETRRSFPGEEEDRGFSLPAVDFSTLILSLSSSAIVHIGDYVDPQSGKTEKNLPLAKQTIDMLGMLQEKTRGNLTQDESQLLENILYNLRMRYVEAAKTTERK